MRLGGRFAFWFMVGAIAAVVVACALAAVGGVR